MSEHSATIRWQLTSDDFSYDNFNRDHELDFGHGVRVPASSAPSIWGRRSGSTRSRPTSPPCRAVTC
jgi:hypothetical protein